MGKITYLYSYNCLLYLQSVAGSDDEGSVASQDAAGKQREVDQLKEQLVTLTNSLATVTAGKSKMESQFQADKRKLRVSVKKTNNVQSSNIIFI